MLSPGSSEMLGQERCAAILVDALQIESNGGMLTRAGDRRRSPGGTFLQLVKDRSSGKERYDLFTPRPVKHPGQKVSTAATPAPLLAPITGVPVESVQKTTHR